MRIPLCTILLATAMLVGCRPAAPAAHPPPSLADDNPVLIDVGREDQAHQPGAKLTRTDEDRVRLVLAELGAGRVHSPADRFNVAIVLQHSPLTFRGDTQVAIGFDNYAARPHEDRHAMEALLPRTQHRELAHAWYAATADQ